MKSLNILMLLFTISLFSCTQKEEVKTSLTFLRTSGQYMVNEQNDTILLRGVGLGNWLLPEGYMWHFGEAGDRPRKIEKIVEDLTSPEFSQKFWKEFRLNYITDADIKRVKELGFNSVRPALNARLFMTEGDTAVFIEENFELLDSLISWCGKHNIYVILDMHGAPGGQTGQNIDDSPNNEPELFMNSKFEHRLTRLWLKLVDRYKDNPVVAGYDLLNEPLPENTGAAEKYKHLLEPMYKNLTAEIRKIDKKHMIILEGYNWSNNWSEFGEPFDDNLVYQFHYYCWSNPDHLNDISYFLHERERLNVPVWVGETGEKNPAIYFATSQYFEKNNIGWSFWPWKKIDNKQVIYSVNAPAGYDKIVEYSRGGAKLSKDSAEMIFTQLLENIKVENCKYLEHITKAWLRQIPSKIFAVNYGHDGEGISYTVNDTVNAEFYRTTEPVKTVLLPNINAERRTSEIAILLSEGEGTIYTAFALENFNGSVIVKAKTENPNSNFTISVNNATHELALPDTTWTDLVIDNQNFIPGKNIIKAEVKNGSVLLLYFDIQKK
jgi:endoglucanase